MRSVRVIFNTEQDWLLPHIRDIVMTFSLAKGFDQEEAFDIVTASDEALTNAVEHAYAESGKVVLTITSLKNGLSLRVRDYGKPLPKSAVETKLDLDKLATEGRTRGMGIAFMKHLMDEVRLVPGVSGKTIKMTKWLRAG